MQGWILPTFGALVLWGFWGFIPKLTTNYLSPRNAVVYEVLGGLLLALVVLISSKFQLDFHPKGSAFAVITGMLGLLGAFCFLLAVSKGPVTLVATVSALYPVVSVLLATFILHESVTLRQWAGIAMAILAMILVSA